MIYNMTFGLYTYGVLLGSYVLSCLPFEIMHQMRLFEDKRIQPARKCTDEIRSKAFTMVTFNFSWLLILLIMASPLLERLFPAEGSSTVPSTHICLLQVLLSLVVDDMCFYCYHRYLHVNKALYHSLHKPHHVFKAPFAWTVSEVCQTA